MYISKPKLKKGRDWSYYAVLGSCICVLMQLYALPRGKLPMVAFSNRAMMVIWIVFAGVTLAQKVEQRFPAKLGGGLAVLVGSLAAYGFAAIQGPSLAVSNGLKLLGFLILPIMLLYCAIFEIDPRIKPAALIVNVITSINFIALYNSDRRYLFIGEYGAAELDVVTLGYPNANQAAMYLFLCAISLFAGIFYIKALWLKILFAADTLCMVWYLQQTGARTALVLLLVFVLVSLLTAKREVTDAWINFALVVPLIYVLAVPIAGNATVMDESLFNGRDVVFSRYFQNLDVLSFFVGDLNRFKLENLHNGYVAIAASVGVPACIGYFHLLKTCLHANRPLRTAPAFERTAFVGFLCAIMYTSAEAAFFVGGSNYAMMFFSVYVLFAKPMFGKNKQGGAT